MKYIKWKWVVGVLIIYETANIIVAMILELWINVFVMGIILACLLWLWGDLMEKDYKLKYPEEYDE